MESPKSALDFLLYCCLTAGTTLIGSFSLGLLGTLNDKISGVCVAVAAGMMTGCSTVLMCEAYSTSASLLVIIAGVALGVGLMLIVDRFFTANPLEHLGTLKGARASRAAVVLLGMMVHSLGEGLCLGLSSASDKSHLGAVTRNLSDTIISLMIPSGAHHSEMKAPSDNDTSDMIAARDQIDDILSLWLGSVDLQEAEEAEAYEIMI
ncbi:conserved hypothetical protein [Perkinsus marinus ATCC 50983]|uniref:Zinc transporter n=1 Tax=Perkinsus marinus (strain ATCC 50983 / TXsc) TaxID=423536 RepID=C5LGV6_PERM5|nr:conserved hypothetical protein [Perkinsus marinus ATCC 50983]EER04037.1 conserved hypothetical protein [Perkinsus marinus ATCC 50983]|eukprot:XP_002772221.1 conserved hypothetical protein [Perkinsus marinus ATCC 50983]